ncbi:MAG TPA: DUF2804 domain-containing protein [Acidimicrobiales bacterium]|nr:DUF2804 domain-containing protein [Acidimicrobiales bacterium]
MSPASSTPSATTGGAPPTVATTEEREITEAVDLCMPDGKHLNPAAKGWSRRPLHTANLRGGWGRTKRWDYWAVLAGDLVVSITYADVDYLGLADLWWVDLATGETGGRPAPLPLGRGVFLPNRPGTWPLRHHVAGYRLDIVDEPAADGRPAATVITAEWTEHGRAGHLHVRIDQPAGHESLNVVIPWSSTAFQYTSKHQARPAHGTFSIGGRTRRIGGGGGGGAGGEAHRGGVVGIQIGGKWTEGTGHTENGMIVDGRLHKIGQELTWTYSWDDPLAPWRVSLPDGTVDLTLTPRHDKHSATNALVLATEVHQVFGTWSGHVTTDVGRRVEVDGIQGFAEESRSRW